MASFITQGFNLSIQFSCCWCSCSYNIMYILQLQALINVILFKEINNSLSNHSAMASTFLFPWYIYCFLLISFINLMECFGIIYILLWCINFRRMFIIPYTICHISVHEQYHCWTKQQQVMVVHCFAIFCICTFFFSLY